MATTKQQSSAYESVLEVISGIQQRIVEAQRDFAETVAGLVPDLPSWVPTPKLPESADPRGVLEQLFEFQERLLESTKAFTLGLVDAWSPAAPKGDSSSSKK